MLENITAENVAIAEDFAPLKFNYKLAVDGLQPLPQITFNITTTRSDVNIEIYCDGVRCPLADPADPTTILFATTDIEEIRIVARAKQPSFRILLCHRLRPIDAHQC